MSVTDPMDLVRGYDVCQRPSCNHQRRYHAPCNHRLGEQDQLKRCGCPAFIDPAVTQLRQTATQAELDAHEAQRAHMQPTLLPAEAPE